jgi:hypothetical protein
VTPGELCLLPRPLRAPSLVCLGVWQVEWINSESGDSLPVELGMAVTLENSRFVPSPWIIRGKIVKFVPEHVWTPAPTGQVPEGSYDREYEKRPPNGYVVVRLYDKEAVADWGRHNCLQWVEYAAIVAGEKLQPTLGDPSEDEGDDSGSETSVEDH